MKARMRDIAAFTLTEALVASALSGLIMALVLTLLVKNLMIWKDSMARLQLSERCRMVRERVLHEVNGQFGLRQAKRLQVTFTTNQIGFTDASSSNGLTLSWPYHQPPVYIDQSGAHPLSRSDAFVESVAIAYTSTGKILNIDFTLALTNSGKKFTQPQQIRVYLLNE
jgi:hypothetical protein